MSRIITLGNGLQVGVNDIDTQLQGLGQKVRDAFYRLRVSTPFTLIDVKQTSPAHALFFDDQQVSGGGTLSIYSENRASTTLQVSNNTAGKRVRQTKQRTNYQPGKSQLVILTAIVGNVSSGNTKRVGYFDDKNGLFFEFTNSTINLVVRSNVTGTPVDTKISRNNWNGDKVDGTGDSGYDMDLSKGQIFGMAIEWLGVGTVSFFIFNEAEPIVIHNQHHNNRVTSVYMSTPVLPIRFSIENDGTGGADQLECICGSVASEGGIERLGANRSVSRKNSSLTTRSNQGVYYPLISLRIQSSYPSIEIFPSSFSVICVSNSYFEVILLINPTVNGTDNASWVQIGNSALEYDISRDNDNDLTFNDGQVISSIYGTNALDKVNQDLESFWSIGSSIDGTPDEFVLAVANINQGRTETYFASLNFKEIV
jgi:hypothetical protein